MRPVQRGLLIAVCMLAASAVAKVLMPTQLIAEQRGEHRLDSFVPKSFGEWHEDVQVAPLTVDPRVVAQLANVYTETLSRTYSNAVGQRVMLSLAYGKDQRGEGRSHYPEVCYPAQGFQIGDRKVELARIGHADIPVVRLVSTHGERVEPITYWVVVGEELITSGLEHKTAIIRYGMNGQIPDGLLVRISSIGSNPAAEYRFQDEFATALIGAMAPQQRDRVLGKFAKN